MKRGRLVRANASGDGDVDGLVLVNDVRDAAGRVVFERGARLGPGDRDRLFALEWDELHVLGPEDGDLLEAEAGTRLAAAAAGDGAVAGTPGGGHWPITATRRGVLEVRAETLDAVNAVPGLAIYSLRDGQVVDAGEVVARVKIIPFVIDGAMLDRGARTAALAGGVVAVRRFEPLRVGAVVQEALGSTALERFRGALDEKVTWLGGTLFESRTVPREAAAIAGAVSGAVAGGAGLVVIAGTIAMDPLDPAFDGIERAGGRVERVGVPAHPGSLLWLARIGAVPVIGMPSCGLFSRATVFDLVLPRLAAGLAVDGAWLAGLGHGGLLTRDMAWRFPPYRPRQDRGEVG